jgi:hypothetical protein
MRIVLSVLALLIGAAVAAVFAGAASWNRATAEREAALAGATAVAAMNDHRAIERLPAPAARYFARVLRHGQRMVTSAVATQDAEFFINGAWRPLVATQRFVADPPGFVWDARISMAPLISAFVRDSYVGGRAAMTASVLGVYPLVDQNGAPELNAGALQRLLGEAVWFPTALLPSERVTWSPRDNRSAVVTLRDAAIAVSLVFEVDEEGRVVSISGDRYKENAGRYTKQPWQIVCDEYRERDGMLIPLHCDVAWIVNGARKSYWRGRIASITYAYD